MSLQYKNRLQALLEVESYDLSWVSARLHSDGGSKVMEAEAAPAEYNAKKLVAVFVLAFSCRRNRTRPCKEAEEWDRSFCGWTAS